MNSRSIRFTIINLSSIPSTNSYAHQLLEQENVHEGTIIQADFQEKGKGQRGAFWDSEYAKNLLISVLLKPGIKVENQFSMSKMMALSVCDLLDSLSVENFQIKWPNDILIDKHKVGGILIENVIKGQRITDSILGLGLNVNQEQFGQYPRKASSLKLKTGKIYTLDFLLNAFIQQLEKRYEELQTNAQKIDQDYLNHLYGYGIPMNFTDESGAFIGVIESVLPNGRLQLLKSGSLVNYDLKQIQFLD